MCSQYPNSTALFASSRKFHCAYPSGGSLHANAVIFARWFPSISMGLPLRGRSCSTFSPFSVYRAAHLDNVGIATRTVRETSVYVFPRSSSNKPSARRYALAAKWPLLIRVSRYVRSACVSCTCCFFIPPFSSIWQVLSKHSHYLVYGVLTILSLQIS